MTSRKSLNNVMNKHYAAGLPRTSQVMGHITHLGEYHACNWPHCLGMPSIFVGILRRLPDY